MLHHLRDIITYILKVSIPCVVDVIARPASLPPGQRHAKYQTLPEHLQVTNTYTVINPWKSFCHPIHDGHYIRF